MTELIIDVLKDVVIDTLKLLPFLFVTYLVMEYLERKTEDRSAGLLARSGKWGPLPGALTGILPQCGFSAAASSLYAGGVITVGTLLAVFLSTSDEMLAIFAFHEGIARHDLRIRRGLRMAQSEEAHSPAGPHARREAEGQPGSGREAHP